MPGMKKSSSMLELDELHDVIKFGEEMQAVTALTQIDEELEEKAAAALPDDENDDDECESRLGKLIRQDTLKEFKDEGFFLAPNLEELTDPPRREKSPDTVALTKKDFDDNVVQNEPQDLTTLPRPCSSPSLQVPEDKSRFPITSSEESTDTNTRSPATSPSASPRQRLESRRRPNRRKSGQGGLRASGNSLTSSLKSEELRSSLKSLDVESVKVDSPGRLPRNVSFSSIEIRSYLRTMGDIPTKNGIPVQLDWKYDPNAEEYSVDDWESYREQEPRREKSEMHMPASHRQYMLMREYGFTRGEIMTQMEIVKKAAKDRHKTISSLKYQPYEEKLEKTRRMFGKLGRSSSYGKLPNGFMGKA
mmetsp:Transcript_139/g.365  ORF Transcript_139/g.365 Transcript_139/m.365 type:complete len:362 (-) Transcript_139:165-1250(-)